MQAILPNVLWLLRLLPLLPSHSYEEYHLSDVSKIASPTRQNDGLTTDVEWDEYSLFLKGQRVFIWSGEFHPWRLPVPKLWFDVLQKMKAAGLNAVSVYVHWGLVNPSPGVFDFEGYRSLKTFLDYANAAGLWVVLRPGPYINAETTAGGIPHWVTSEVSGHLRTNDTSYQDAWVPYIQEIARIAAKYQITEGGPIIAVQVDNEYEQNPDIGFPGKGEMMREVQDELRKGGIVVPLTYNDAHAGGNFVEGVGAVDLYGLDSYPQRFDCSHPETWNPVVENYFDFHLNTNPKQPWYTPEFQGGAFDAWGPTAPGYEACGELTDEHFESVFYKNLWAHNFKLVNIYMVYGGTSWGHLPNPGVYTSYDYGAAISEARQIESPKFAELKRQSLFVRSTPEFYKTDVVGNSSDASGAVKLYGSDHMDVFVTLLQNPDTNARFYIARHQNSTSGGVSRFKLAVDTPLGELLLPQTTLYIALLGRESRVITTGLTFGRSSLLLYSTPSVLYSGLIWDRAALVVYGSSTQDHELAVQLPSSFALTNHKGVSVSSMADGFSLVTISRGVEGLITLFDSPDQIVIYADEETAGTFWFPPIETKTSSHSAPFHNYWQFGTNSSILIAGPHLVRRAISDGDTVALEGDLKDSVRLIIVGLPKTTRRLSWNGQPIEADLQAPQSDNLVNASLSSAAQSSLLAGRFDPPELKEWRYKDSLPEIEAEFDDSNWIVANYTVSNIPGHVSGTPALYGCDYGFCEGTVIWRGHFDSNSTEKSVTLAINGGAGFAGSVWLNCHFLGTSYGNSTNNRNIISETNQTWTLPLHALTKGDNVITVVQDNMGLEETLDDESGLGVDSDASKSPRGIRFASIDGGRFSHWKVQGKLGGYTGFKDRKRGIFNEGGTFAERNGWHLPETNTSSWERRDLQSGLPKDSAGLGFFVTTFDLDIPEGFDVPMSFNFDSSSSTYRAILFVNGWMMGKRVAYLGPQYKFPVHEGILDYRGPNAVAVLLWSTEEGHAVQPSLSVSVNGLYDSGFKIRSK